MQRSNCAGGRASPRKFIAIAAVMSCLSIGLSGCADSGTESRRSENVSQDPGRASEPVGLPEDPDEIRQRVIAEWSRLLESSGVKYVYTQFSIGPALGDDSKSEVRLSVSLGARPEGEWSGIETKLGAAAKASGWRQAGISHGLNVRKDPYFLRGGCSVSGCDYELTTAPVSEDVAGATDAQMVRTPELERFKAPGAPAQAPTDPPA